MANLSLGASAQITPFNFGAHAVRVIVREGEPWFVAHDVCEALDYKNTSKAVADHLDSDERSNVQLERGGSLVIINESGLYALVLRSRKPEARKFAKWVTGEVLPSIRKTGGYGQPAIDPERLALAHKLASHAVAEVWRTVHDAVLAGDDRLWRHQSYQLSLAYGGNDRLDRPWCRPLPLAALTCTLDELPGLISQPDGINASDLQLAGIAAACTERLQRRMSQRASRANSAVFQQTAPGVLMRVEEARHAK